MAESKEYVKLWLSYDDYFRAYDKEAVGTLVLAMIAYRRDRTEPQFSGPERFIWPALKKDIDEAVLAQEEFSARCSENGKKGGRPRKEEKPNPFSENPENPTLFSKSQKTQLFFEKPLGFEKKEEGAPLVPPSPSPPTPPVFSPPYNPPNLEEKKQVRTKRFTPPTLAEVQSYVAERHSAVDPQEFIDFYESKGWMVGKTPMKDWKAACRNAEKWDRWARQKPKQPFVYDYGSMEGSL